MLVEGSFFVNEVRLIMADLQVVGSCTCGRALSSTHIHMTEDAPFMGEAQMNCGACQKAYRVIVIEEILEAAEKKNRSSV